MTFANATSNNPSKKRAIIFSDSMAKRILPWKFNRVTPTYHTTFRSFPGANTKSLNYYLDHELTAQTYDTVIIHCGTNDISPRRNTHTLTDEEIAHALIEMGLKAKRFGPKTILISGIIPRKDPTIDTRRINVNSILQRLCIENNFCYVDNCNVTNLHLWKDGIHLLDSGIELFSDNLINFLNDLRHWLSSVSTNYLLTNNTYELNSVNNICNISDSSIIDSLNKDNTSQAENSDIRKLKLKNPTNITAAFLNINSIRNKLDNLKEFIRCDIDILAIGETKLDNSFSSSSISLDGYNSPFRFDSTKSSGGLLVYVNGDIPSKVQNKYKLPEELQIIPYVINLRKQKWLVVACYKLPNKILNTF